MAGTQTNRTAITLPPEVSGEIMQKVQENSAIMQLAQQIKLPGAGTTINVITGDPEAAWVTETSAKPVSNPSLATKIMQGYKIAVIVPFSMEFERDAKALYDAIVARLPRSLAEKFDKTVIAGTAPGTNFDVLTGCTQALISSDAYTGLVTADADIATHGGITNGYVISPQAKSILLSSKDTTGRPIFINSVAEGAIPMILGSRTLASKAAYKAGTPNIVGVAGDWTQAMYGTVEGVKITKSYESTLDVDENTKINLFQQNMFAVRAEIEVGFVADTSCFNLLTASA